MRWWEQWKKFVGYNKWDQFGVGEKLNDPGHIDNSSLFASKTLHHLHYFISHRHLVLTTMSVAR